ncbi:MAG: response regulator [Desulfamplus sp.]|nr:response regulator [Desulfamplus sp.]
MTFSILLVDDSMPMRAVIKKAFIAAGYAGSDFSEAQNGIEALERLKKSWIDLVVTDFTMPVMNGLEMLLKMKQHDIFKDIPVLVVTTEGSQEKIDQFMNSGAAGYIRKPFTPEQLRDMITNILGESHGNEQSDNSDNDFDF